jgi:hypothetical protein
MMTPMSLLLLNQASEETRQQVGVSSSEKALNLHFTLRLFWLFPVIV